MKPKNSIIEVARLAGVSKSTVSRLISERGGPVSPRAEAAIRKAIEQLGYTRNSLAAGLRASRTYTVLLVVPDIANPFWSGVARAVQDRLESSGYSVVVGNTDFREAREAGYIRMLGTGRFDGAIINSVTDDIAALRASGLPTVLIGERSESSDIDTVGTQTYEAATIALEHLYALGHRRIALATGDTGSERYLSRRFRAYEDFHVRAGLPVDRELVFPVRLDETGGRGIAERIVAARDRGHGLSAILCGNDLLAIGVLNSLRGMGIEPGGDISLVGMDDIPSARMTWPPLTTIRKPGERIGTTAAELLLARIDDPDRPFEKHLFPGELVERGTVKDLRGCGPVSSARVRERPGAGLWTESGKHPTGPDAPADTVATGDRPGEARTDSGRGLPCPEVPAGSPSAPSGHESGCGSAGTRQGVAAC